MQSPKPALASASSGAATHPGARVDPRHPGLAAEHAGADDSHLQVLLGLVAQQNQGTCKHVHMYIELG